LRRTWFGGVMTGVLIGAALGLVFAPRAVYVRRRMFEGGSRLGDQARNLTRRGSETMRDAARRVGMTVSRMRDVMSRTHRDAMEEMHDTAEAVGESLEH